MSEITNAKIVSTNLGFHDGQGSIPTFNLQMSGDGWGQGFGGFGLGGAFTHGVIYGILNTLEVESWEKLAGTHCRIERDNAGLSGRIVRIGHLLKDKWFDPRTVPAPR